VRRQNHYRGERRKEGESSHGGLAPRVLLISASVAHATSSAPEPTSAGGQSAQQFAGQDDSDGADDAEDPADADEPGDVDGAGDIGD
jgi:hypothetical protein